MSKGTLLNLFALIALPACLFGQGYGQNAEQEIRIVGRVIAYDDFINVKGAPQSQYLIVKVSKLLEGREQSTYVKVLYQALHGQQGLPKEMENSQSQWFFTLRRVTSQDEACKEPAGEWVRTKPETDQAAPDFDNLTCYLLSPGGFKRR